MKKYQYRAFYLLLIFVAITIPVSATCEHGACPWGVAQCTHVDGCFQENSKFYLRQAYCDDNNCCQYTEREVKCCNDYCDRMSTPSKTYYCDYDKGCVELTYLKVCPAGYCCLPDGGYKVQECLPGKECCMQSQYMGICKESCEGVAPKQSSRISPFEQFEHWFYEHILYFILVGVLVILWIELRRKKS